MTSSQTRSKSKRSRLIAFVSVVLLVGLVASGCGGDDDKKDDKKSTTTTSKGKGASTTDADGNPTDPDGGTGDGSDAAAALGNLGFGSGGDTETIGCLVENASGESILAAAKANNLSDLPDDQLATFVRAALKCLPAAEVKDGFVESISSTLVTDPAQADCVAENIGDMSDPALVALVKLGASETDEISEVLAGEFAALLDDCGFNYKAFLTNQLIENQVASDRAECIVNFLTTPQFGETKAKISGTADLFRIASSPAASSELNDAFAQANLAC